MHSAGIAISDRDLAIRFGVLSEAGCERAKSPSAYVTRQRSLLQPRAHAFHCFQLASNSALASSSVATWFDMRMLPGLLGA